MKQRKSSFHGVVAAVKAERARQAARWGSEHDSRHSLLEWVRIIEGELMEAYQGESLEAYQGDCGQKARRELVHVATVAVAALEWYGVPEEVEG